MLVYHFFYIESTSVNPEKLHTANIQSTTSKLQENDGRCNKENLLFTGSTPGISRVFLLQLHEIAGMYRNLLLSLPSNYKSTSVIMENHYQYEISVSLWNSNLIMKFQSYYGSFQNALKRDEIRQSQNDMKKK